MQDINKQKNVGRKLGFIILLAWIVVCIFVATSLYIDRNYYEMTGWLIASILFILIGIYYLIPIKKNHVNEVDMESNIIVSKSKYITGKESRELAQLISTKDCIKAQVIVNLLRQNDIVCIVYDKHSTHLMRFLPDVEMRIMVPAKDYEKSVNIVEDLLKQE